MESIASLLMYSFQLKTCWSWLSDTGRLCICHCCFYVGFCLMFGAYFKPWKFVCGNKYEKNFPKINCTLICISLLHIKITVSVTKSLYQDCATCYLHLPIFFLNIHSPLLLEKKVVEMLFSSANQTK